MSGLPQGELLAELAGLAELAELGNTVLLSGARSAACSLLKRHDAGVGVRGWRQRVTFDL